MSQPTAPETLGSFTDETPVDPNSKPAQGDRRPVADADRRRPALRDKIAMVCAAVVVFFVADRDLRRRDLQASSGSPPRRCPEPVPRPAHGGMPLKRPAQRTASTPTTRSASRPSTADDNLAYWLYGCRTSLIIASVRHALRLDRRRRRSAWSPASWAASVDQVISFFIDLFLTFPFLLAALAHRADPQRPVRHQPTTTPRSRFYALVTILALFGWMGMARLIRGEVLSLREREFVQAARVIGVPDPPDPVQGAPAQPGRRRSSSASRSVLPAFIAAEAGLAFLGIGVTAAPSWGQTINTAVTYFEQYPLYLWEPVIGIVLLVALPQPARRRHPRRPGPEDPSLTPSTTQTSTAAPPTARTQIRKAGQMKRSKPFAARRAVPRSLTLAACGGGGDDGDTARARTGVRGHQGAGRKDPDAQGPAPRSTAPRRAAPSRCYPDPDDGPNCSTRPTAWSVTDNSHPAGAHVPLADAVQA